LRVGQWRRHHAVRCIVSDSASSLACKTSLLLLRECSLISGTPPRTPRCFRTLLLVLCIRHRLGGARCRHCAVDRTATASRVNHVSTQHSECVAACSERDARNTFGDTRATRAPRPTSCRAQRRRCVFAHCHELPRTANANGTMAPVSRTRTPARSSAVLRGAMFAQVHARTHVHTRTSALNNVAIHAQRNDVSASCARALRRDVSAFRSSQRARLDRATPCIHRHRATSARGQHATRRTPT